MQQNPQEIRDKRVEYEASRIISRIASSAKNQNSLLKKVNFQKT